MTIKYSNSGVPLWTNRYDGPPCFHDRATAVAVDDYGNVFVTGPSQATNIQGDYDYVTIKYSAGLPQPAHLDFRMSNNRLVLSWADEGFCLQSAPSVGGTFANVFGATSPYTNSITGTQEYFRLKSK